MRKWRIEDSAELYNINGWGLKYFSINDKGHVAVTPREGSASVDLKELMDELQVRDVTSPVLLRFPDILDNRIEKISKCFQQAADEYGYTAKNFIIYPIKVNQMRQVVEEIVSHGKKFNIGLEAGSKPELHAVLAINTDENSLIICNGYKDENYVELALLAQKMGRRIFLVVEKLNELRLIADISKRLKIRPNIGIRIKLASSGSGKWEESGGDGSKFGLNSSELLEALDFLEKAKMTDCLKLIHFHIGSQITKIRRIKNALKEASQFYVQLQNMGFHVEFVDIGGGLGVDYDGTGAYQEILGDMHNLFGDTNAVHVSVYKDRYEIDQVIDGETVAEVLDYVQFSPKKLVRSVETWVTSSMKAGIITPEEGREFLSNYRSGLYGYTYLEND